jgi:hypothetical protein
MDDAPSRHRGLVDALVARGAIEDSYRSAAGPFEGTSASFYMRAPRVPGSGFALPIDAVDSPAPHEEIFEKRWTRLVLDRPGRRVRA